MYAFSARTLDKEIDETASIRSNIIINTDGSCLVGFARSCGKLTFLVIHLKPLVTGIDTRPIMAVVEFTFVSHNRDQLIAEHLGRQIERVSVWET